MVLLDTNVVLRRANPASPEHGHVAAAIQALVQSGETCCICAQNLVELWAVLTRPADANGMGLSPSQTRARIDTIRASLALVPDPPDLLDTWLDLCTKHEVRGRQTYDARLVAFMIANGIIRLVTLNPIDFARYHMIQVVDPRRAP